MILLRKAGMGLIPPAMLLSRIVGSLASLLLLMDRWEERTFGAPLAKVLRTLFIVAEAEFPTLPRVLAIWEAIQDNGITIERSAHH